jgi:hypothetical protein
VMRVQPHAAIPEPRHEVRVPVGAGERD